MSYWKGDIKHGWYTAQRNLSQLEGKSSFFLDWWWRKYDQTIPGCCELIGQLFGEHVGAVMVYCLTGWTFDDWDIQHCCENQFYSFMDMLFLYIGGQSKLISNMDTIQPRIFNCWLPTPKLTKLFKLHCVEIKAHIASNNPHPASSPSDIWWV